jgi:hypothetical protein
MSGMEASESGPVLVQVVEVEGGRQIGRVADLAEQLGDRMEDVRRAIAVGARTVADSLPGLPGAEGWGMDEVTASFGVTLTAEAGAILSKASAGATFEVCVTYRRNPQ